MLGAPRKPGGGRLDYSKTAYAEAEREGLLDDNISALLHKVRGRWTVVKYVLGATDVPYIGWDEQYRAPSGIFPHDIRAWRSGCSGFPRGQLCDSSRR